MLVRLAKNRSEEESNANRRDRDGTFWSARRGVACAEIGRPATAGYR